MSALRWMLFLFLAVYVQGCETVCEFSPILPDDRPGPSDGDIAPDGDQPDGDVLPDGDEWPDGDILPDGDLPDGDIDGDLDADEELEEEAEAEEEQEIEPSILAYAGHQLIEWTRDGLWRYDTADSGTGRLPEISASFHVDLDTAALYTVPRNSVFANPPSELSYYGTGTFLWSAYRPVAAGSPTPDNGAYFLRRMRQLSPGMEVRHHSVVAPTIADARFEQAGMLPRAALGNSNAALLLVYSQNLSETDAFLITQAFQLNTTSTSVTQTPLTVPLYLRLTATWHPEATTRVLNDGTLTWVNAGDSLHSFNSDGTANTSYRPNFRRADFSSAQILDMDIHPERNWAVLVTLLTFTNNRTEYLLSLHRLNAPVGIVAEFSLGTTRQPWRVAISPSGSHALVINPDPSGEQTLYMMHLSNALRPVRSLALQNWGRPVMRPSPDRLLRVIRMGHEIPDAGMDIELVIEMLELDDLWDEARPVRAR